MSLPVPDLDDRRFQDLVDEAKRMIPSLVPEWTNHNVADPGVALIELFAWMSEQVIFRLNQVPEKLYVEFLNLLGTAPFPASAARVDLTFWLAGLPAEPVVIRAGTEVTTDRGGVVFATIDELRIVQPTLSSALTSQGETVYVDVLRPLQHDRDAVACFASDPVSANDALHLGFEDSLAGQMVELTLTTAGRGIGVDPTNAPIVWEAWSGEHWLPTTVLDDTTGGLNRDGIVRLVVPQAHEPLVLNGERHHWLRVRLIETAEGVATYQNSPRIRGIEVACRGGSVAAEHARTVRDEVLGTSDGGPDQHFGTANRPVLPRDIDEHVQVTFEGQTEVWDEVPDFSASGPADRHIHVDGATGEVRFGPFVRYPDGSGIQHGAVPPFGSLVAFSRYRTGGGAAGNVSGRTLSFLRSAIPHIAQVTNLEPARGGVDPETLDEVKLRGPRTLRTGQRAVTASDYEQLTLESSPQVARARCLPPSEDEDAVRLLVLPTNDLDPQLVALDDFALVDDLYDIVKAHLDERRTLGTRLRVLAPYFQGVSVIVRVRAVAGRSPVAVKERITAAIARHLSPLHGGSQGNGWPFGEPVTVAGLTSMIEAVQGVSAVDELALFEFDLRNGVRIGDSLDVVDLEEDSLFLTGRTQVVVR